MQTGGCAAESDIWGWLGEVPDPEIPAISVVDLGIVREVHWDRQPDPPQLVVTITPTYSGCPATEVIFEAVREKLLAHGIRGARLVKQLSPAWTTDWMNAATREKLRGYGIAPPPQQPSPQPAEQVIDASRILRRRAAPPQVCCPQCGSPRTEVISEFGSTPCKALYRCLECREPFDHFKRH